MLAPNFTRAGYGLLVTFDAAEIVPDDPGAGTPVMVATVKSDHTGTWHCAVSEGELDCGAYTLSEAQLTWLRSLENTVDHFYATYPEGV